VIDELAVRSTTNRDGSATLTVAGEIDLASAPRFRQALDDVANTHSAIAVDLRAVTYFDSSGVDVLFTYATKHRIKLTIGDNRILAAVIKVSGLEQVVTLYAG
jgi:anti-anti-sigma factor